jgi:hypothetical protein
VPAADPTWAIKAPARSLSQVASKPQSEASEVVRAEGPYCECPLSELVNERSWGWRASTSGRFETHGWSLIQEDRCTMAISTTSHAAKVCRIPGVTKTAEVRGDVMTERSGGLPRLAAVHVVDFERVR